MPNKIFVTKTSMPSYEEYIEAIKPLWESHWLTNMGVFHQKLEKELANYLKVPEISLVVNGHMALELAIQSFDFPEGAEVITTPFTFISTTHAIVRNRLKPIFCDIKENDGTIDESKIENLITERTVAIVPVHVYGNKCNIEAIEKIAEKYGLRLIFDAAHAFGENYNGQGIGNFGDASIFSFHATKVFNTIEGGAVVCKKHDLYEKMYNLKNFGIRGEEEVDYIGANSKMNEFCAIMGLCNLRRTDKVHTRRTKIANYYYEAISNIRGIRPLILRDDDKNYSYYPVVVENEYEDDRDCLFKRLAERDIFARKYFYPLTCDAHCYTKDYALTNIPIARDIANRVLTLPIFEEMTDEEIERVIFVLAKK